MKELDQLILETPSGPLRNRLTEINIKLAEALTPGPGTKAAYIGEFSFNFPAHDAENNEIMFTPNVPWTTIKEVMTKIRERMDHD